MKNLYILMHLMFGVACFSQIHEWHVKPSTDNSNLLGDGLTFATAWSIQNAFNNPAGVIVAGDIIWLHGGDYKGNFECSSALNGTSNNYIKIKSFPGEWARLDGNVFPYVVPTVSNVLPSTPAIITEATVDEELNSYLNYESNTQFNGIVLKVSSGFIQFEDFEVTCLGNINRLNVVDQTNLSCSNGFHGMTGINHDTVTVNRFINLVVRNIPGIGIGSWKNTDNSEIYGCLIYNNGYISRLKTTCSNNNYTVSGRGPGIYSQNASNNLYRKIKNNIIMNNYDSGLFVWSASTTPTFDYLKNYTISKNFFINNGGPQRDETANMIVRSLSGNSFNHPSNINIDNNIYYINNRSSYVSGINVSNSISVYLNNNYFFKGTAGMIFNGDNFNVNFQNNFFHGKRMQVLINPINYNSQNWTMNNNTYFTMQGSLDMFHVQFASGSLPQVRHSLPTFQSLYNDELNSTRSPLGLGTPQDIRYLISTTPPKTFVTQNIYNPNKFYVTIFNPNPQNPSFNNINVDVTSYNIPNGSTYKIKDAENYFGSTINGILNSNNILFPMTLTDFELPIGVPGTDYSTTPEHSFNDLHVFILEFDCVNSLNNLVVQNQIDNSTISYLNNNKIQFGTNYIAETNSNVISKASSEIKFISNCLIKGGSNFHAEIENNCNSINYIGENINFSRESLTNSNEETKLNLENKNLVFPNPNNGIFKIKTTDLPNCQVIIKNSYGFNVYESNFNNSDELNIALKYPNSGIYIVEIVSGDNKVSQKILIQ